MRISIKQMSFMCKVRDLKGTCLRFNLLGDLVIMPRSRLGDPPHNFCIIRCDSEPPQR